LDLWDFFNASFCSSCKGRDQVSVTQMPKLL
jgi:hypothetical protein